jgi:hypothetical protein
MNRGRAEVRAELRRRRLASLSGILLMRACQKFCRGMEDIAPKRHLPLVLLHESYNSDSDFGEKNVIFAGRLVTDSLRVFVLHFTRI